MYIETFKVFCDLAETGSFSKAAALNSITQSAVSQQIRSLENRFQVTLVERSRRNFNLTPEGRAFLDASKEILDVYNHLGDRLHELRNVVAGELSVASIYSIGLHELPP
ncbi:MAG: LysR family transcriptional regulator, partial [Chthoniobacteraceae bacterium]